MSFQSVHWIYNTLSADKYFGTPFGIARHILQGPALYQLNLSISKNFSITEKMKLQIRAEATNAFNHVSAVPPRIIKLGPRFIF